MDSLVVKLTGSANSSLLGMHVSEKHLLKEPLIYRPNLFIAKKNLILYFATWVYKHLLRSNLKMKLVFFTI